MAFATSSSMLQASVFPMVFLPVSEKLHRGNFQSWKAQVISALNGMQLIIYIEPLAALPEKMIEPEDKKPYADGKKPAPVLNLEYVSWPRGWRKRKPSSTIFYQTCPRRFLDKSTPGWPLKACSPPSPTPRSAALGWRSPPQLKVLHLLVSTLQK